MFSLKGHGQNFQLKWMNNICLRVVDKFGKIDSNFRFCTAVHFGLSYLDQLDLVCCQDENYQNTPQCNVIRIMNVETCD